MRAAPAPQTDHSKRSRARSPRRGKGAWEPAIRALADPLARKLAALGRVRRFPKDSLLIREGEASGDVFVILDGVAAVYVADGEGREMILGQYASSQVVGEMALAGQRRCASVRALESTVCCVLTRKTLHRAIRADPEIALQLFATAARRIRSTTDVVKSLALTNVYGRVAALLARLEYVALDGALWSREPLRQQDIANRVGASRDMISRVLKQLRLGGYIAVRDRRITILRRLPARW